MAPCPRLRCTLRCSHALLPAPEHRRRHLLLHSDSRFTVTLADRSGDLLISHIDRLRSIYQSVQTERHFESIAVCILPDHPHAIWSLPTNDTNFARRWNLIKGGFSRG